MPGHDRHAPPNPGAIVERLITKQRNEKPREPEPNQPRACGRCQFSMAMADPQIIGKVTLICNRMPPTATIMPGQGGGGRAGVITLSGFPQVSPAQWCWEFKEKPSTEGE